MLSHPFLHVIGADPRRLLHAIRFDNAHWSTVGDVEGQAGQLPPISSVATAGDGASLHLFVAAGSVHHTIRHPDGTWTAFEDIATTSGGQWVGAHHVAAAVTPSGIHLCGVASDGALIHAVFSGGTWSPPSEVPVQTGGVRRYFHVACASDGDELHVVAAPYGSSGIRYTFRHADGTWDPMVELVLTGQVLRVGCARVLHDLHIVATPIGLDSPLWFIAKNLDKDQWSDFLDVKTQTGNPGIVGAITASNCADELHVMVSTNTEQNWRHTIRHANGTWQPFGDVWTATVGSDEGTLSALACAGLEAPPETSSSPTVPALAFESSPCVSPETASSLKGSLDAAVQRIAKTGETVAGLLGGAQADVACVDGVERGGVFIYSESTESQALSVALINLFSRSNQGAALDFSILFATGAVTAALAAVWDSMRSSDGSVRLPNHPEIELLSYALEFLLGQIKLDVFGQARAPGGLGVGFTAHYTDTFSIIGVDSPPDGTPSSPHRLVASTDAASLDIAPEFDFINVFLIPGLINAIIGDLALSYAAPGLPGKLSGGLGGVVRGLPPKDLCLGRPEVAAAVRRRAHRSRVWSAGLRLDRGADAHTRGGGRDPTPLRPGRTDAPRRWSP